MTETRLDDAFVRTLATEDPADIRSLGNVATMRGLAQEVVALRARVSELEAARIAYASEFPLTDEGELDYTNTITRLRAALEDGANYLTDVVRLLGEGKPLPTIFLGREAERLRRIASGQE